MKSLRKSRLAGVALLAGGLVLGWSDTASAHGIGAEHGEERSVLDFLPLGIEHMLLGFDHLLFILGILLLAGGDAKRAVKMISLFVVGHSTTLIAATLAGWQINATAVDVVIALSVVFVGVIGLRGKPSNWRWFGASIFGFGLIHGLGLSTRLQDLGLPEDGILARVISFNVGIEIGQCLAILVMVIVGKLLNTFKLPSWSIKAANIALIVAGLLFALFFIVG